MGNGRAIAIAAARAGAAVVCADRDAEAATETARLIEALGGSATVVVGDVAHEDGCRSIVEAAGDTLDGLVLNVGIASGHGLAGTSATDWDRTFAVNLRAHFLIVSLAADRLIESASHRLRGIGGRTRPRQPASRLRRLQGRTDRTVPSRGPRVGAPGYPGQRGRPRSHRHPPRAPGHPQPPQPGPDPGAARSPGHGLGSGRSRRLPALPGRRVHHRSGPGRRRRIDAHLMGHRTRGPRANIDRGERRRPGRGRGRVRERADDRCSSSTGSPGPKRTSPSGSTRWPPGAGTRWRPTTGATASSSKPGVRRRLLLRHPGRRHAGSGRRPRVGPLRPPRPFHGRHGGPGDGRRSVAERLTGLVLMDTGHGPVAGLDAELAAPRPWPSCGSGAWTTWSTSWRNTPRRSTPPPTSDCSASDRATPSSASARCGPPRLTSTPPCRRLFVTSPDRLDALATLPPDSPGAGDGGRSGPPLHRRLRSAWRRPFRAPPWPSSPTPATARSSRIPTDGGRR